MFSHTQRHASLFSMLICLTLLGVIAQLSLFVTHYRVSALIDSLVTASLLKQFFHPAIFLPLMGFLVIQVISYGLFILWILFLANACGGFFKFSSLQIYIFGLILWLLGSLGILSFNNYFFTDSFFSQLMLSIPESIYKSVILFAAFVFLFVTLIAYYFSFHEKKFRAQGSVFLFLLSAVLGLYLHDLLTKSAMTQKNSQPNIILIGLDSLRPDFIHSLGNKTISTPNIDAFLKSSTHFTTAYTPLGRTFPAWASILTAKHPRHTGARNNLVDPETVLQNETLAKKLQQAGYETIYATDEKRFSNITHAYGFDQLLGPRMGINDFILGGLSDFPLTNLLINLNIGRLLFPYNYANRAAAITYTPHTFLHLLKLGLANRSGKPLFLAVHFCLSHWPFTWANDHQPADFVMPDKYQSSVEAVDAQLGEFLKMLQHEGLLQNSLVVLLSDHGTSVGLHGDRIIKLDHYVGDKSRLSTIPIMKISKGAPHEALDFAFDTSYGQGSDILSMKQYRVVLAFKGFGIATQDAQINTPVSLMDIAPTVLEFLHLPSIQSADGISLNAFVSGSNNFSISQRLFALETAYTPSETESGVIDPEAIAQHEVSSYHINSRTGLLTLQPDAEQTYIPQKQRAIIDGDWLLARFPASVITRFSRHADHTITLLPENIPPLFVLVNLRTEKWTIGLDSSLANDAPTKQLLNELKDFYGNEIS